MIENSLHGQLLQNESLARYTTWRVGGIARAMYKPKGINDLANYLKSLPSSEPIIWLGLGSNSLIKDTGFAGNVILTQGCLENIELIDEYTVRVEAGVSCAKMARYCARNHLADAEFWAGIPGTMGGALRMNAGCFKGETWQSVTEVETIDRNGQIKRRSADQFTTAYRNVVGLEPDEWFIAAICNFAKGDKDTSLATIKELLARRSATQPTSEYNCGSVFRNPPNNFAAKIIEDCKLKGYKIGGAQVSKKHANFIINDAGEANADDIERLINFVRESVYAETGIKLIQEVHIIGE